MPTPPPTRYVRAIKEVEQGRAFPYDRTDYQGEAVPWARLAAWGVLNSLLGRSGIGDALESITDYDIREEIVDELTNIIGVALEMGD